MTKLLLTGVFKPFGVTNEYSDDLCSMELLQTQVTREQGIHSPRFNNLSFGLYLLAENLEVPTTVLDFPSWKDFTKEIDKGGYSHVGISFIVPNVLKAQRMSQYIRKSSPGAKIILGGHGTAIPELARMVDCDEICAGEGIGWLRKYFGENTAKPIQHPVMQTRVNSYVYGMPLIEKSGIIMPGVGCQNSCRFCSTTHKFDKKYNSFLPTGKDIYDVCASSEKEIGVTDFGLMDENFCKIPVRARELLIEMEKHGKAYTFSTFSSAETVLEVGVDFLVRSGINFLWIGVESKNNLFAKTKGIDLHKMIHDLQSHGITVLASAILFLEHHDKNNIQEEIDWAIGLESDLLQFMQLGLMPGTRLYLDYVSEGKVIDDYPWEKRHGQNTIWFRHPNFTLEETSDYLIGAFQKKYQTHGPGVLNMAHTAIKGYLKVRDETEFRRRNGLVWDQETLKYKKAANPIPDNFMKLRLESMKRNALKFRPMLNSSLKYAPNPESREKVKMVIKLFQDTFGALAIKDRVLDVMVRVTAFLENIRIQKNGVIMRQPRRLRTRYGKRSLDFGDLVNTNVSGFENAVIAMKKAI